MSNVNDELYNELTTYIKAIVAIEKENGGISFRVDGHFGLCWVVLCCE